MKAQLGQNFQNHARLDFQLSRQLVDTNLTQMFCSLLQHWQHNKHFKSRFRATEATRYFLSDLLLRVHRNRLFLRLSGFRPFCRGFGTLRNGFDGRLGFLAPGRAIH